MTASAVSATAAGRQSAEVEGEPQKHRTPTSKRLLNASLPIYTALLVIYMFLPIAVMIIFSFNDPQGRQNITWQGFTIQNYFDVWSRPDITGPMLNSLLIALVSTIIATILGTLIGLALTRYQFRGQTPVNLLIYVPMATPEVIMGASLLALWVSVDVARGMPTILIAHVMFCISFVVVTIRARISGFNRSLEEAAMDLGADSWTTFRKVTLPLIFPGILAAAMLSFALSIDDYVITSFVSGQTLTFPLWVYGASRLGMPPEVNVLGTLIFATAVVAIIAQIWWARRRAKQDRLMVDQPPEFAPVLPRG
jgi:spermidine/putrescine transport system permease protein